MISSVYIETYGCQMNKYDTEIIAGILSDKNYTITENLDNADIILFNTCSVRAHAEQRVYGRISELSRIRIKKPEPIIGICGCMAQQHRERLLTKFPFIKLIIGPDSYHRLPELIDKASRTIQPQISLTLDKNITYSEIIPYRITQLKAWVAISRGCDNYCAYCVVPNLRGRERSRPASDLIKEITELAQQGYKEITLLGQNVNSYHDGEINFSALLKKIDSIDGIERIRFTTSHPRDMTSEIIDVIAEGNKICEHLHLPVQSGSTSVLSRMNRGYTAEQYLELIQLVKTKLPCVSITTDIIVGFPGETDRDFQATVELMEEVEFDSAFTFKYSPREGTAAFDMEDSVPEPVKQQRLETLISLQRRITYQKNLQLVGKTVEVLVEGKSKRNPKELAGRTRTNKVVIFSADDITTGSLLNLRIIRSCAWTLWGEVVHK